jgi:hypothetical protein
VSKGTQIYPGAKLDLFFGNGQYSGSDMEVNTSLLHTTEGMTLVNYSQGAVAPTGTMVPDFDRQILVMHQHFNIDESARALVNKAGGVETNTNNVCQWELVGTCDPATKLRWEKAGHTAGKDFIYWPEAPTWALDEVAKLHAWLNINHGIPLTSSVKWKAYPSSYGTSNGVRLSNTEWNNFRGICGHQHAPENVHGDPGDINIAYILSHALAIVGGTPKPSAPVVTKPTVDLSQLIHAFKVDPGAKQGHQTYPEGVKIVEKALYARGYLAKTYAFDGSAGKLTVEAYRALQKHYGYTGKDADGIPGEASLTKLGKSAGFTVVK